MGRKPSITQDELLAAAMRFVDEHGLAALSLRSLAPVTGASHTAMYAHFATRADMLNALAARVLREVLAQDFSAYDTPREQLVAMAAAVRSGLLAHPHLVPVYLTAASVSAETALFTAEVLALLESAGLESHDALVTYQVLESFVLGFVTYEVGTETNFLGARRDRYRAVRHPETKKVARSDTAMRAFNDEAFHTGFARLLAASGL